MRRRDLLATLVFAIVTLALSGATAAVIDPTWLHGGDAETQLLRAALVYVAVFGWQPLVGLAIARSVSGEHRDSPPARRRFSYVTLAIPIGLLLAAARFDMIVRGDPPRGVAFALDGSAATLAGLIVGFVALVAVLWLQALVEELAWRGFVMTRLMRGLGAWQGLAVHGLVWGAWYALVLHQFDAGPDAGGFMLTCWLLGVLLGWIRLASGTIYASAAANAILTICGALPLVLHGLAAPLSAIYLPIGWLPLAIAIWVLVMRRPRLLQHSAPTDVADRADRCNPARVRSITAFLVTLCLLAASGVRSRVELRSAEHDAHVTDASMAPALASRRTSAKSPDLPLPPFVVIDSAIGPRTVRTTTLVAALVATTPHVARVVPRSSRGPPLA